MRTLACLTSASLLAIVDSEQIINNFSNTSPPLPSSLCYPSNVPLARVVPAVAVKVLYKATGAGPARGVSVSPPLPLLSLKESSSGVVGVMSWLGFRYTESSAGQAESCHFTKLHEMRSFQDSFLIPFLCHLTVHYNSLKLY